MASSSSYAFLSNPASTVMRHSHVHCMQSSVRPALCARPILAQRRSAARFSMSTVAVEEQVAETASQALCRFRETGLTLANAKDLYWMVDYMKKQFYDKGNYYYPVRTICDGESIDVELFCPFEPKLSPHYTALHASRVQRSELYAVPPNNTDLKRYNKYNCEKMGSLMAPNTTSYQDTEMVGLFYSMMYYLNDQTAHFKLPEADIQMQLIDELNDDILQYLNVFLNIFEPRDPEDLERIWDFLEFYQPYFNKVDGKIVLGDKYQGRTPPQIGLVNRLTGYISTRFAPTKNITQIIYEVVRYIKGIKYEIKIRCDKSFTLSLKEYAEFRDLTTSSAMAHSVTDLTYDDVSYKAYTNPLFIELENLTSESVTYFNDVCTCERERVDNDPFNSVFILRNLHGTNYADACKLVVKEISDKQARIGELKELLLNQAADEGEKKALAQMVKTREDSLIGYLMHEVCCVTFEYARDYKPLMKEYFENQMFLAMESQT